MNDSKLKNFSDFVHQVYENQQVSEDKYRVDQSGIKAKTDDSKIKIQVGTPDAANGERVRYNFKYVHDSDIDDAAAKAAAQSNLSGFLTNQLQNGSLSTNMVGFLAVGREGKRALGDYVFKGVLSFYDASKFPNLSSSGIKPIASIPANAPAVPTQGQLAAPAAKVEEGAEPQNIAGQAVEAEEAPAPQVLNIYDASAMTQAATPGTSPKLDLKTALASANNVPEPAAAPTAQATEPAAKPEAGEPAGTPTGTSYVGLKKDLNFNEKVKDLQARIIAKGVSGSELLKNKGGADGKYGDATAAAIQATVGAPAPVTEIDQKTSDNLNVAFTGLDQAEVDKIKNQKPATPPATTPPAATPPATPGGAHVVNKPVKSVNTKAQDVPVLHF